MRWLTMLVCAAVAGLSGCGGEADPPSPSPSGGAPASHGNYLAQADRLCAAAKRSTRAQVLPLVRRLARDGLSVGDAMRVNREAASAVRPAIRRVEALPRPADRRAEIEAYLAATKRTLHALDAAIAAHARGDRAGVAEALARNRRGGPQVARTARRAGFKECGSELGAGGLGLR